MKNLEFRNARFANAEGTLIDVEINHPVLGWVPFTASPEDSQEYGREIFHVLSSNEKVTPFKEQSP